MAWIVQNNQLINDEFINSASKPFVGDSPDIMWTVDTLISSSVPSHRLMLQQKSVAPFHGDSPYIMWRYDHNVNNGVIYSPLMPGFAATLPTPPIPTGVPFYYNGNQMTEVIYNDNSLTEFIYNEPT